MRVLLSLVFVGACSANSEAPDAAKDMLDQQMDAPMAKGELDALSQAMGSERLEGMEPVGRKVAKDGKSGMIQFSNPNAEPTHWNPVFTTTASGLHEKVNGEDIVLAYFFSSDEDELQSSAANGKAFDEAALQLAEGDHQVTCLLLDIKKYDASEFGVTKPHEYKIFKAGRPFTYDGPREAKGIVAYMTARAGAPLIKLSSAKELDAVLESASAQGTTVVVGALGAGYDGVTARNALTKAAFDMREPLRLMFYETSVSTANGAAPFVKDTPFSSTPFSYVIVQPTKWRLKGEPAYVQASDWKRLHSFIPANSFPTIYPLGEQFRAYSRKQGKELVATILYDVAALSKKHRYILKQLNKVITAEPELASQFAFAIADRSPFRDPYLIDRFDRTTVKGKFFGRFAEEYPLRDFAMVVSNMSSKENWLVETQAGTTPEGLDSLGFVDALKAITDHRYPALAQGSAAAAAAGLKEMAMGFGGGGDGGMMEVDDDGNPIPNKKKKSKKTKRKAKASPAKDEV